MTFKVSQCWSTCISAESN